MEELVAELGSAFLSADLDLAPEPRADHAAYIALWLKVLKNDKRAIFTAASCAQRAADYLRAVTASRRQPFSFANSVHNHANALTAASAVQR